MLYHLAHILRAPFHGAHAFTYISVRSVCALLTALFTTLIFERSFIHLAKRHLRSEVREDTPQRHHDEKHNTPTMGGLLILGSTTFTTLLWTNLLDPHVWVVLSCLILFGGIGVIDDYRKIQKTRGISARCKFMLQLTAASIVIASWMYMCTPPTKLCVPFLKSYMPTLGSSLFIWGAFIILSTSNAVNLTDGLDGLAGGLLMSSITTFSIIAYLVGNAALAHYLYIPYVPTAELCVIGAAVIGTLLGFLWYNAHPAELFMGDVGSLPLGALLGLLGLMTRQELLIVLIGGIFFVETLSVIAQVISFKTRGKRIFKMAPIHHHFELSGLSETKITVRFWIVSLILALLALLTLKLR